MTQYCIRTEGLSKIYEGKLALNNINLEMSTGGVNAIVGSNGAGKSTLFKILLGMVSPSFGQAHILGRNSANLTSHLKRKIGYVNEEHSLPNWMQVEQVIIFQRQFYPQWDKQLFNSVIGYFNVDPKQKIASLSRGERAGVNLAMAFAQRPELLILDEPTLGLDVIAKQSFLEAILFTELNHQVTFIYCSHQMDEIQRVADNLIILETGQIKHNSEPDTFCDRVSHIVAESFPQWQNLLSHPNVLKVKPLDELLHIWVLDDPADIEFSLTTMGSKVVNRLTANLEQAVNAFLTRGHSTPKFAIERQE